MSRQGNDKVSLAAIQARPNTKLAFRWAIVPAAGVPLILASSAKAPVSTSWRVVDQNAAIASTEYPSELLLRAALYE